MKEKEKIKECTNDDLITSFSSIASVRICKREEMMLDVHLVDR